MRLSTGFHTCLSCWWRMREGVVYKSYSFWIALRWIQLLISPQAFCNLGSDDAALGILFAASMWSIFPYQVLWLLDRRPQETTTNDILVFVYASSCNNLIIPILFDELRIFFAIVLFRCNFDAEHCCFSAGTRYPQLSRSFLFDMNTSSSVISTHDDILSLVIIQCINFSLTGWKKLVSRWLLLWYVVPSRRWLLWLCCV